MNLKDRFIMNTLINEKRKINSDNRRLLIQVETCEKMIMDYKEKIETNNENIDSINDLLNTLQKRSTF